MADNLDLFDGLDGSAPAKKTKAARNVREVFEGRPPLYPVNRIE